MAMKNFFLTGVGNIRRSLGSEDEMESERDDKANANERKKATDFDVAFGVNATQG